MQGRESPLKFPVDIHASVDDAIDCDLIVGNVVKDDVVRTTKLRNPGEIFGRSRPMKGK